MTIHAFVRQTDRRTERKALTIRCVVLHADKQGTTSWPTYTRAVSGWLTVTIMVLSLVLSSDSSKQRPVTRCAWPCIRRLTVGHYTYSSLSTVSSTSHSMAVNAPVIITHPKVARSIQWPYQPIACSDLQSCAVILVVRNFKKAPNFGVVSSALCMAIRCWLFEYLWNEIIILASCLINAQPLPAHSPAADDNSLIGCTKPRPDRWLVAAQYPFRWQPMPISLLVLGVPVHKLGN